MATFGKKNAGTARAPSFGKRTAATSSAGVFGAPAHPQGQLSPEARAFLDAERSMRSAPAASPSAFPLPAADRPASAPAAGKPAGKPVFGRRIIARILDELLVIIPMAVILWPSLGGALDTLATAETGSPDAARANLELFKAGAIMLVAQALYGILMESSGLQATLGKMLVGAVVTNTQGGKPSLGSVIMRNTLGRFIVNVTPFYLGYLIALFRKDRKGLHDLMAGSMVRARAPAGAPAYTDVFA